MSEAGIAPHGGRLRSLLVDERRASELRAGSETWMSWELTPRQLCDLELLLSGAFSPLTGFMARPDYERACLEMRLTTGELWPIPVTLDVTEALACELHPGRQLALRDPEGTMLAVLHVSDVWQPNRTAEAELVFGTTSPAHPGVAHLLDGGRWYVGGNVEGVQLPVHHDFAALRLTPVETRAEFSRRRWERVVAFQTRNPIHRAHHEMTLRALRDAQANLLIHPCVGITRQGDVDPYTRVRCYQALIRTYPSEKVMLSLLPLAMRMAGPREALWHAIIRKNYGCTHFIVGRDHAGPGNDVNGKPFYGPYDAQELLRRFEGELGISIVRYREMMYAPSLAKYLADDEVPSGVETVSISGTELRQRLDRGLELPAWFTFPAIESELRRARPPRGHQGFTVLFTGLSGAGKSTIANVLRVKLLESGERRVTLLDGDIVRKVLSSELGFSREHRDINIRRIGFVAAEITKNGGVAICAPIAPYDAARKEVRAMIEAVGGFVLTHVATPLAVCEQRDRKGLYAKARAGTLKAFTGISDPYEVPDDAEVVVDASFSAPEQAAREILAHLARHGFIRSADAS